MISLIFARDKNNLIGHKDKLPWHIPDDLKHFKAITYGSDVVMGSKTYFSIGKPLPNRQNWVLTKGNYSNTSSVHFINDYKIILKMTEENPQKEIFIIGGSEIYKLFLPHAQKMYITEIDDFFFGDIYFPEYDYSEWKLLSKKHQKLLTKDDIVEFYFCEYVRK
jgi:dihydrofolate reductase